MVSTKLVILMSEGHLFAFKIILIFDKGDQRLFKLRAGVTPDELGVIIKDDSTKPSLKSNDYDYDS